MNDGRENMRKVQTGCESEPLRFANAHDTTTRWSQRSPVASDDGVTIPRLFDTPATYAERHYPALYADRNLYPDRCGFRGDGEVRRWPGGARSDVQADEIAHLRSLTEPEPGDTDRFLVQPPTPEPRGGRRWYVAAAVLFALGFVMLVGTFAPEVWPWVSGALIVGACAAGLAGTVRDGLAGRECS